MDANPKQLVAERLRGSTSVLITVSANPSVDQLASAIGLSLMLDKLDKRTTAVFSGRIPNALQFLEPEKTFDTTVDGLRDFIISLDKEKADKLRYKVEDDAVRIYITPYKSMLSERDLQFSQGDYNVDLVVALGVHKQDDLDKAITTHGRILHDASIVTINAGQPIGSDNSMSAIDWTDPAASSLSEMLVSISEALESGLIDSAISTAFLTGIVASTERFKNERTTPKVMTMAAQLMAAGANQQLIATNLQKAIEPMPNDRPKRSGRGDRNQNNQADNAGSNDSNDSITIDRGESSKQDEPVVNSDDAAPQIEDAQPDDQQDIPREDGTTNDVGNNSLLSDIEEAVQAKHLDLDENGRTKRPDDEDPAILELEQELANDNSSSLIELENRMKTGPNKRGRRSRRNKRDESFDQPEEQGPVPQSETDMMLQAFEPPQPQPQPQPVAESYQQQPYPQQQPYDQAPQQVQEPSLIADIKPNNPINVDDVERPMLGGTFNATAEQAHDQVEEDRRKALNNQIFSHNGSSNDTTLLPPDSGMTQPSAPFDAPAFQPQSFQIPPQPQMQQPAFQPAANAPMPAPSSPNDIPDSASIMHDLEEARRAVEEAMDQAEFSGGRQPHPYQDSHEAMANNANNAFNLPQMPNPQMYNASMDLPHSAPLQQQMGNQSQQPVHGELLPHVEPGQSALPQRVDIHT